MEVVGEIRDLAAVTAACCFPRSVRDLSLSLLPDRLYWPCLKTRLLCWYWKGNVSSTHCCYVNMKISPDEKKMSRCRRKISSPPLLISRFPQVPVSLPPQNTWNSPPFKIFSLWMALVKESLLSSCNSTLALWKGFIQFNIKSGIGTRAREWNTWQYFGSGNSRRFFSQAGVTLRERHSLLRPIFLSELSTSRTAPKTARPPPTAPGVNIRSCSIPSRRGVQRFTQMKEGWFRTIQARFT